MSRGDRFDIGGTRLTGTVTVQSTTTNIAYGASGLTETI